MRRGTRWVVYGSAIVGGALLLWWLFKNWNFGLGTGNGEGNGQIPPTDSEPTPTDPPVIILPEPIPDYGPPAPHETLTWCTSKIKVINDCVYTDRNFLLYCNKQFEGVMNGVFTDIVFRYVVDYLKKCQVANVEVHAGTNTVGFEATLFRSLEAYNVLTIKNVVLP